MPQPRYLDFSRNGDPARGSIQVHQPVQGHEVRLTPTEKQRRHRAGIRTGTVGVAPMAWTQPRNGLPETPGYRYRARWYPQAQRAIATAEAEHGPPRPTCFCGQPAEFRDGRMRRCPGCGRTPGLVHSDTAVSA